MGRRVERNHFHCHCCRDYARRFQGAGSEGFAGGNGSAHGAVARKSPTARSPIAAVHDALWRLTAHRGIFCLQMKPIPARWPSVGLIEQHLAALPTDHGQSPSANYDQRWLSEVARRLHSISHFVELCPVPGDHRRDAFESLLSEDPGSESASLPGHRHICYSRMPFVSQENQRHIREEARAVGVEIPRSHTRRNTIRESSFGPRPQYRTSAARGISACKLVCANELLVIPSPRGGGKPCPRLFGNPT